jgi:hypothetical protein
MMSSRSVLKDPAARDPDRPFIHDVKPVVEPEGSKARILFFLIARRGGARRDRTDDLMLAKHALYQLSYGPSFALWASEGRPSWRQSPDLS